MKLLTSEYGRKIKIQFWLSDWSGHNGILDFLETYEGKQSEIGVSAFALIAQNQGFLQTLPMESRVTAEMRDLLAKMRQNSEAMQQRQKQLEDMQALVIDLLKNATLSPANQAEYTKRLEDIQQMIVIEGAGNYGSELLEVEEDEFGEW